MPLLKCTEFRWSKIGSYTNGNPFTIAFCYPSDGKPFVLKGGINIIEPILKGTKVPLVVHQTYWKDGHCRSIVTTYGFPMGTYIHFWKNQHKTKPNRFNPRRFAKIIVSKKGHTTEYNMRRFPRCFPDQLRKFIE
jgi:hypothetical protein